MSFSRNGGDRMMGKIPKTMIENCIKYRANAGLTQEELAKRIGCSRAAISNFESGKSHAGAILLEYLKIGGIIDEKS